MGSCAIVCRAQGPPGNWGGCHAEVGREIRADPSDFGVLRPVAYLGVTQIAIAVSEPVLATGLPIREKAALTRSSPLGNFPLLICQERTAIGLFTGFDSIRRTISALRSDST